METRTGVTDSTADVHVHDVRKSVEKKGRNPYTKEEDQAIRQFVNYSLEISPMGVSVSGNKLWQKMEKKKITNRTWSSMRDRYLKHIRKKPESESDSSVVEDHSPRRLNKLPLTFINSTSDESGPCASKRARRRVYLDDNSFSSSFVESPKRPDAAPVLHPEPENPRAAVNTRDVHQDIANFSDDSDMSNFDEVVVNLAESETESESNDTRDGTLTLDEGCPSEDIPQLAENGSKSETGTSATGVGTTALNEGCSSEDISKLAESGKKNETESDATVDGTVTPNEGCPSEDIPQLAENGSKSETGTSATGEGTTALNEGCPSEDIPQLAENGSKSETGTSATGEGTTALNEGCSSEDISKLAESGKKNETESDATVDGTVTPNEGCPSEDIPQLAENGSKSETGTSATGEGTTALNEDIPNLSESGSKSKTGTSATEEGTSALDEGCSRERIRKSSKSSSVSETGSSTTEDEIANEGQMDTWSLERQMEKLSPEHFAVLESVDSLRLRTNATLAQIIHSLFCTNASLRDATAYLVNGETENVWTLEDDNILMGRDEEAIHKLIQSRGSKNVESRILFLGKRS